MAGAGVVEESVVRIGIDDLGVYFTGFLHGFFDRRNGLGDARVAFSVDGQHACLDIGEIALNTPGTLSLPSDDVPPFRESRSTASAT